MFDFLSMSVKYMQIVCFTVKYEALADAGVAHHILVFGCKGLKHNIGDIW